MNREHENSGFAIAKTLDSPEAISRWKADPLGYLKQAGFPLDHLDQQSQSVFGSYLANTEVRLFASTIHFKCTGCKIAVASTLAALTAILATFIAGLVVGSDGVDVAVAPEEVEASASAEEAAVAAETDLSEAQVGNVIVRVLKRFIQWAEKNPMKAVALIASSSAAIEEIMSEIVQAICKAAGDCDD